MTVKQWENVEKATLELKSQLKMVETPTRDLRTQKSAFEKVLEAELLMLFFEIISLCWQSKYQISKEDEKAIFFSFTTNERK